MYIERPDLPPWYRSGLRRAHRSNSAMRGRIVLSSRQGCMQRLGEGCSPRLPVSADRPPGSVGEPSRRGTFSHPAFASCSEPCRPFCLAEHTVAEVLTERDDRVESWISSRLRPGVRGHECLHLACLTNLVDQRRFKHRACQHGCGDRPLRGVDVGQLLGQLDQWIVDDLAAKVFKVLRRPGRPRLGTRGASGGRAWGGACGWRRCGIAGGLRRGG